MTSASAAETADDTNLSLGSTRCKRGRNYLGEVWPNRDLTKYAEMLQIERIPLLWVFLQVAFAVSWCFTDMETGPGAGVSTQANGDSFKIEGRAIVPGVKTQDWVSAARVLVEGEEYVGFLR